MFGICLNPLFRISYEFRMNFVRISYEFRGSKISANFGKTQILRIYVFLPSGFVFLLHMVVLVNILQVGHALTVVVHCE